MPATDIQLEMIDPLPSPQKTAKRRHQMPYLLADIRENHLDGLGREALHLTTDFVAVDDKFRVLILRHNRPKLLGDVRVDTAAQAAICNAALMSAPMNRHR
jgi:hypothetical protein